MPSSYARYHTYLNVIQATGKNYLLCQGVIEESDTAIQHVRKLIELRNTWKTTQVLSYVRVLQLYVLNL